MTCFLSTSTSPTLQSHHLSVLTQLNENNPHHQKKNSPPNPAACPDTSFDGNPLLTFEPVTDEFFLKMINIAPAKSCELDPIPTTLLYENLDILLPTITNIINTSLTTGIVPRDLKTAIVKPLLKIYRPISNLPSLKMQPRLLLLPLSSHGSTTATVSLWVHLILSSNLSRKFKTLLKDLFSWDPVTTTQQLSWKNCTGFLFQNVLNIKSLVCVSIL